MLKLFRIPVRIDLSWLFVLTLVIWSLATGVFPILLKDTPVSPMKLWVMGCVGALGLFLSILLHELSHSLVARRHGLNIKQITLFIFGGVAEIADEPPSSQVEFRMAIAGPLTSIALSGLLFLVHNWGLHQNISKEVLSVVYYLAWINSVLAVFNLVPAFPLDGGRILRSILWSRKQNLVEATRLAAKTGRGFGIVLMGLGVLSILLGNFIGGIWYFLIGMFLREAAEVSYRQVVIRKTLEGEKVRKFMNSNPVVVRPDLTLEQFVDNFLIKYPYKMFPVVRGSELLGTISMDELKTLTKSEWSQHTVQEYLKPVSPKNSVAPESDAKAAFMLMSSGGESRLLVVQNEKLVGVLTLKDILSYISVMFEFEEPQRAAA